MTVELWYGKKPAHSSEQEALVELYQYLMPQTDHFVLLVNFHAGPLGNEVDLAVLKETGVFLAELKHVRDPLVGEREGDWKIIKPDGEEIILNKGRMNPFRQVQTNYHRWKEWCEAHREQISKGIGRSQMINYARVMTYIVLYPDMPEGSRINIGDFPVQAVGFPKFRDSLLFRADSQVELSRQELSRIPQLLKLAEWQLVSPKTMPLGDWQLTPFAVLVSRGHNFSAAVFKLDALDKESISVGRSHDNDLIIHHPSVSAHHAVIERYQGRYVVRDLGSTSGTFVSFTGDPKQEMKLTDRANAIKNNSTVRFGPAEYTFLCYQ